MIRPCRPFLAYLLPELKAPLREAGENLERILEGDCETDAP